jgi:hypothetical protein
MFPAPMRLRAAPILCTLALATSVSACAAIWGFQDATDLLDGGQGGSDVTGVKVDGVPDSGFADSTVDAGGAGVEAAQVPPDETAPAFNDGPVASDALGAVEGSVDVAITDVAITDVAIADADTPDAGMADRCQAAVAGLGWISTSSIVP